MRFYPFVFTGEEHDEETSYGYCDDYQPHAVKRMFDYKNGMLYDMRWDEAGNLGQVSMAEPGGMFQAGRFLYWTEDNRMHTAVDDRYYSYDNGGERVLKLAGSTQQMGENGMDMSVWAVLDNPTLYTSPYMVITPQGYTKHYYAGADRVCAKIGNGGLDYADSLYHQEVVYPETVSVGGVSNDNGTSSGGAPGGGLPGMGTVIGSGHAGTGTSAAISHDLEEHINPQYTELRRKASRLFNSVMTDMQNRVLPPNDDSEIKDVDGNEFGWSVDESPQRLVLASTDIGGLFAWQMFDRSIGLMVDDPRIREEEVYYYHSDHLGGANWITNAGGEPVQYLQYLPFGEPLVNHRTSNYNERFTFTGKERDEETGYNYHGARYYDAGLLTGWLSVDPLADKYPGISSYAYCNWNPVKLVDPDGRETYVAQNQDGTYRVIGGKLNKDRNIYLYKQDKNGEYTIRCGSIGKSITTTSFYNTDANNGEGAWAIGSRIDPTDKSGVNFLGRIVGENPTLKDYMKNAMNGQKYDFKVTNGEDKPIPGIDTYRGMPIGGNAAGDVLYASARDIGNVAAGYIAGANGISWENARIAFDAYQSYSSKTLAIEGRSTRNAEYYGWRAGANPRNVSSPQKLKNFIRSVKSYL